MSKNRPRQKRSKKKRGKKASSAVTQSVSTHANYSTPAPTSAVGSRISTNLNQRSPFPQSQNNLPASTPSQSDDIIHITEFGSNAQFAGPAAFGANSTATHNAYHIRLGDRELTETQVEEFMAGLLSMPDKMVKPVSSQSIADLPRSMAAHNDYRPQKEREPCFEGTREAVLKEIENWFLIIGTSQVYVLSGLAGIGKSTIAYTIAQRANHIGLLGASFFFSRKEAERRTAEKFFTTIAFHLCVYDDMFAHAIARVLATNLGKSATTKDPETQLKVLIIEPLRDLVRSRTPPVVIVVDALDECEDNDAQIVLKALGQLVHEIPHFKVLLTARPQLHLNHLLSFHNVFYMHNIEKDIVNNDIRSYLKFRLSTEQVKSILPTLRTPWSATDDDIDALVQAAGTLFIIASISVPFILNKAVLNPASQMKRLRRELAQSRTSFTALDDFYSIILHSVVPPGSDRALMERFQMVVGTIVLLCDPLPVKALADLISMQTVDIYGVLDNLQSIILLGVDDIPYIYHKSFSDWILDTEYFKDKEYRIDTRDGHTWLTIRCLQIMNERLKRNILNIDGVAQFMTNNEALKQRRIKEELQKKISSVLQYACIYWTRHLKEANVDDANLIVKLKIFAHEHLLHWIEALGWIMNIISLRLHHDGVLKFQEKTSSVGLRELLSDAFRFICKFWPLIAAKSALRTYHSALPFTPTESLLYQRYKKEMVDNICRVHGGPKRWDAVINSAIHGQHVDCITFIEDGGLKFASYSAARINFWHGNTGTWIAAVDCERIILANSFGITVTWREFPDLLWSASFEASVPILSIAHSSYSHRLAAALSNGSVTLWVVGVSKPIAEFHGFGSEGGSSHHLAFSPNGDRLAYRLVCGGVALRNAIDGEHVIDLNQNSAMVHRFLFSPDGSQLASLFVEDDHKHTLMLLNCTDGKSLGAIQDIGSEVAFSADGSLIATGGFNNALKLWSSKNKDQGLSFIEAPHLSSLENINCLAFSPDDMLAIGSANTGIILYDVAKRSLIATIPFQKPTAIAFSHNCTRLAIGNEDGVVRLLDVQTIKASAQMSQENSAPVISALAFSPDCSCLVSGSEDGIIRIWNTSCAIEPIVTREGHLSKITTIGFAPKGGQFASGDANGRIKLWSGDDGALSNTVQWPISGELTSVAVSNYLLAGATKDSIALWDLQRSCIVDRLGECGSTLLLFSNQDENLLLASFDGNSNSVTMWDVGARTTSATFSIGPTTEIERMAFYPDDSHLFIHHGGGKGLLIFDVVNKILPNYVPINDPIDRGVIPSWKGIPVLLSCSNNHYSLRGRFSEGDGNYVYGTVCQLPEDLDVFKVAYGSSMFALLCKNGSLVLLQSN